MGKTFHWNAYLPVGAALRSEEPGLDPAWAAAMGVDAEALAVLRRVRRCVLPLVRELQKVRGVPGILRSFSFSVHDRASGVPCPPEDSSTYIHLRLETFEHHVDDKPGAKRVDVRKYLPKEWVYVSQVRPTAAEECVNEVLASQSAWYLQFIEDRREMSDVALLQNVGQALHFFANMAQMMVR